MDPKHIPCCIVGVILNELISVVQIVDLHVEQ